MCIRDRDSLISPGHSAKAEAKEKPVSDTKLFADIKKKYFKGKTTEEVLNVLEQALASWFAGEGDVDV